MIDEMQLKDFTVLSQNELKKTEGGSTTVLAYVAAVWIVYEVFYAVGKAHAHIKYR